MIGSTASMTVTHGNSPMPSAARSASLHTATTPGTRARRFQIHANDTREGMGRADHMGVQHARHMIVGDIFPAPGEEANILQPVQGLTLITLAQLLTVFPKFGRDTGQARQALQDVPPSGRQASPNDLTRAPVLTFQNVL